MSDTDKLVGLNVILMLSPEVVERARELSAICQQFGTSTVLLNDSNMLPHLTLHQCPIVGGVPALKEVLQRVLLSTSRLMGSRLVVEMEHSFSTFMNTGLFWNAQQSGQLGYLHSLVVKEMNTLRQGYILSHHAPMLYEQNLVTAAQRASLLEWGSPLAKREYLPHVTLANMSDSIDATWAIAGLRNLQPALSEIVFPAQAIAIAGIGPFGTCPEIFETISLV